MIKRVLIIVLLVFLCACNKTPEIDENVNDYDYIDPINDVFIFDEIDDDLKNRIKLANGNSDFDNYQFKMLNKTGYANELVDINGKIVDLKSISTYLLEVVSVDCKHCKEMVSKHLDTMRSNKIQLVQYFNVGAKAEIIDFYNELGIEIPTNIAVIEHNDDFDNYIRQDLKLEMYPSLVCFYDNVVSFCEHGNIEDEELNALYDVGFINRLSCINNQNDELSNLISSIRTIDDVQSSLRKENVDRLKALDNNGLSLEYSLKIMGTKLIYDNISNGRSLTFINEINDYSYYKDKDVVLIYTAFSSENEQDKINYINNLISSNQSVEYIVVLIEGIDSSSNYYQKMNTKLNCKVTSILGYTPDDFTKLGISKFPTALFVKKSTFTGAYSNIESVDMFNDAIDMFLSDKCIAFKSNN